MNDLCGGCRITRDDFNNPYATCRHEKSIRCVVKKDKECNNKDFSKCEKCIAPSWCFCTREGANMGQSIITSHSSR